MHINTKILLSAILISILAGAVVLWWAFKMQAPHVETPQPEVHEEVPTTEPAPNPLIETIGSSVDGRAIEAYTFGTGATHLLFVGGMHGGYEWNSALLAYAFIDDFTQNPSLVPEGLTIHIIPDLNPDGTFAVLGKEGRFTLADVPSTATTPGLGRFNAHDVDLNRNFDCKWKPTSSWRGNTVSAGSAPFSEPEAMALREYVLRIQPSAVIFWHSQSNAVYASECESGILPLTRDVMSTYATAAHYPAVDSFTAYPVSGDAEGWLASIGIPAITVELSSHEAIEWDRNRAGVFALFDYYTNNLAR